MSLRNLIEKYLIFNSQNPPKNGKIYDSLINLFWYRIILTGMYDKMNMKTLGLKNDEVMEQEKNNVGGGVSLSKAPRVRNINNDEET